MARNSILWCGLSLHCLYFMGFETWNHSKIKYVLVKLINYTITQTYCKYRNWCKYNIWEQNAIYYIMINPFEIIQFRVAWNLFFVKFQMYFIDAAHALRMKKKFAQESLQKFGITLFCDLAHKILKPTKINILIFAS